MTYFSRYFRFASEYFFFFLPFLLSSSENEIRSHQYVTLYPTQAHPKFSDIRIIRKMQKDKT